MEKTYRYISALFLRRWFLAVILLFLNHPVWRVWMIKALITSAQPTRLASPSYLKSNYLKL